MKTKVTLKEIRQNYNTILSIGYCNMQSLLHYSSPFAYSGGVDGWNCDFYDIDNICISTGYRPIGSNVDVELRRKYEAKAEKIIYDYSLDYKVRERRVNSLLSKFVKEATKQLSK